MSGTRISALPGAPLPLSGTEEVPLRAADATFRVPLQEVFAAARRVAVAHQADNTPAGGNARGANAVDLQTSRLLASQVASGANAVIGGGNENTASGLGATIAGGWANTASGQRAAIAGGTGNTADGLTSWVPGGSHGATRGHAGRGAWAASRFASNGDAQAGEFVLRQLTSDATPARMTADGAAPASANTINLPNNATYRLKLLVVAQQTGGSAGTVGDCAEWEVNALIRRGASAAATVLVGGMRFTNAGGLSGITAGTAFASALRDAGAVSWALTLSADTTNGGLAVTVTGEANKTIRWVVRVQSVEVTA
jgi:hypothetical protein